MLALKNWDIGTSIIHFCLATTVTLQLVFALLMKDTPWAYAFPFHKYCGLLAFLSVIAFWLWSFFHKKEMFAHLFPWSKAGLISVKEDLNGIVQGKLPQGGPRGGLPGLVHGLGLLAVTGMACTGFCIFLSIEFHLHLRFIKQVHVFIANLIWIYWFGHVIMAVTHKINDRRKAHP